MFIRTCFLFNLVWSTQNTFLSVEVYFLQTTCSTLLQSFSFEASLGRILSNHLFSFNINTTLHLITAIAFAPSAVSCTFRSFDYNNYNKALCCCVSSSTSCASFSFFTDYSSSSFRSLVRFSCSCFRDLRLTNLS